MFNTSIGKQSVENPDRHSSGLHEGARDLVHGLVSPRPKGATVDDLHPLVGILDEDSAREMMEAIATGCEGVERNEG